MPGLVARGGHRRLRGTAKEATSPRRGRRVNWGRLTASPLCIAIGATIAVALFCILRVIIAGHGTPASLVVAGSAHVRLTRYTRALPIINGPGYDGQFYYRLALSPTDWARNAFGIKLDNLGRLDRPAYPALVWLAAGGGQVTVVPWMMVAVNVLAFGALVWSGAKMAATVGTRPLWGLLPASYFGFLWSMSRDLTELTEAAFVLGGLLAIKKDRPLVAGFLLAGAVLSRENGLLVVGAVFLARAWEVFRRREAPGHRDMAWFLPLLAFSGWQIALLARTGTLPVLGSGHANTTWPIDGLAGGLTYYARHLPHTASLIWAGELAVLAAVVALGAVSLRSTRSALHERIAWVASGVLALVLAKGIWLGDVGFRSLDDLWLLSCVLLLNYHGRERLRLRAAALAAAAWSVAAVQLVLFI